MRVLVTGSRQIIDQRRVYPRLDAIYDSWLHPAVFTESELKHVMSQKRTFVVVHGSAAGADTLANTWVWDRRGEARPPMVEPHPANWARYGRLAGPIRNQEMVDLGADLVLAFFQPGAENRGTQNCVNAARLKGLTVEEFWD